MLRVAIMQPTFLPWEGYFGLVANCDIFVFLDDAQLVRNSWHHRNKIASGWVTVPAKGHRLNDAPTGITPAWRESFGRKLDHAYSQAPFHEELRPQIDRWIATPWHSLADMNRMFIKIVAYNLGFRPYFLCSSNRPSDAGRSGRVLELLRSLEATDYMAAAGSREYMEEDGVLPIDGVSVHFEQYPPSLSVLDSLFRVGPVATREIILAQTSWETIPATLAVP